MLFACSPPLSLSYVYTPGSRIQRVDAGGRAYRRGLAGSYTFQSINLTAVGIYEQKWSHLRARKAEFTAGPRGNINALHIVNFRPKEERKGSSKRVCVER